MISYSLLLMLIGMGTVFVFLLLLVGSMNLLATLTAGIRKGDLAVNTPSSTPVQTNILDENDETLLGVIASAIHAHRSRQ